MRRLRLQGQNERLLREAVRELVVEEPKSGARMTADVAEFFAIKPGFHMNGPWGLGAVGAVFYPNTGFLSGFSASIPFLVAARKGKRDQEASAYLLMFENDTMAHGLESVVQNNLIYPPSFRTPTSDEIRQIFKDSSWTSIPRAVLPSDVEQPRGWETRFRIMEELPKDNPNPLLLGRRQGRLDAFELELHKRRVDLPGRQKIWRIFGEVAPTSLIDVIVAGSSVLFDILGAAAESIDATKAQAMATGPSPHLKVAGMILLTIKSGNMVWSIASVAGAAASLVDSIVDLNRVNRAESINPYAGRSSRLAGARTKVLLNTFSLVLGVLAAACDVITAKISAKKGPDVATKVEKVIRVGKICTTVLGLIAGAVDSYEFFRTDVVARLMPYKEEILAAIEGIKADPSKLGVSDTKSVVTALDMLVVELNKA